MYDSEAVCWRFDFEHFATTFFSSEWAGLTHPRRLVRFLRTAEVVLETRVTAVVTAELVLAPLSVSKLRQLYVLPYVDGVAADIIHV